MITALWIMGMIVFCGGVMIGVHQLNYLFSSEINDDCCRGHFTAARIRVYWDNGEQRYSVECKSRLVWHKIEWFHGVKEAEHRLSRLMSYRDNVIRDKLEAEMKRKWDRQQKEEYCKARKSTVLKVVTSAECMSPETAKIIAEQQIDKMLK